MSKKDMIHVCPTEVCTRNFWLKAKRGKITGSESATRFLQASCFKKPTHSVRYIGAQVLPRSAKGTRKRDMKLNSCAAEKGMKKLVSSIFLKILE